MLQRSACRAVSTLSRRGPGALRSTYSTTVTGNTVQANDPNPKERPAPASATNATATSSRGAQAHSLQETPEAGEEKRVMQAPNRSATWSRSQQPRELAMAGPRFEQTIMEDQVCCDFEKSIY
jgi:NADH dehydrogenase (ubiquinone) Fe-S protein 6